MRRREGGGQQLSALGHFLRSAALLGAGLVLLLILFVVHVNQGQMDLSFGEIWNAVFRPDGSVGHQMVRHIRFPRAAIGCLAGAALAVAGVLFQTVTRNPMASAGTLGVNAGAYLAVVAATVFAPTLLSAAPLIVALAGALLAATLVYLLAGGLRASPIRLALGGVTVSLVLSALTGALQLFFENQTAGLFFWGAGSLLQNDWSGVLYAVPRLAAGLAAALLLARSLDVLLLGDDVATGLGANVGRTRLLGTLTGIWLAAVTVSVVGPIGFVGLIVPHLMRLLGLRHHLALIGGSAVWGAVILLGADVLARLLSSSSTALPAGAVTAVLGAPWLVWLAARERSGRGGSGGTKIQAQAGRAARISYPVLMGTALAVLVAVVLAGLALGGLRIDLDRVFAVLVGGGSDLDRNIVFGLRLPRMLVAAAAGAALAVSGLLLQGVVRNPLADPSIVGVTSGAGLGAMLLLIVWPNLPGQLLPLAAFLGACAAFGLVYLLARRGSVQPVRLALMGIAVSAFGSALIQVLVIKANMRVAAALVWLTGSTYARGWPEFWALIGWPVVLIPAAWGLARGLDLLAMGDDVAAGLGLPVERSRFLNAAVAVALAAAAVATVGTVGFVGLMAPHIARMLIGSHHRRLLPLAAVLGAALLTLADVIGRSALAPREVPAGLVVTLVGAPYFVWMMWRAPK